MCIDRFSVPNRWHPISFHQKINERDLEPMSLIKDLGVVCSVICIFLFVFVRHTNRNNVSLLRCTLSPRVPLKNCVLFENIIFFEHFFYGTRIILYILCETSWFSLFPSQYFSIFEFRFSSFRSFHKPNRYFILNCTSLQIKFNSFQQAQSNKIQFNSETGTS